MNEWIRFNQSGTGGWNYAIYGTTISPPEESGQMDVYEYLVVYTGDDDYEGAKVLVGPKISLAADVEVVRMEAARAIPQSYANKLDDIDIHVRKWA